MSDINRLNGGKGAYLDKKFKKFLTPCLVVLRGFGAPSEGTFPQVFYTPMG
jgi:hypothetical protein